MSSYSVAEEIECKPFSREEIQRRLEGCPCLPSLSTIDKALKEILSNDDRMTSQIAEIIRRDPSLSSRLLRLVNSVYYGVSGTVKSIEEAVFYLGVRQVRELTLFTPVIEDLEKLGGTNLFPWREFWRHSIAVAVMTREIMELKKSSGDELNYLAGLIHDVGKIVMAATFPKHFKMIYHHASNIPENLLEQECRILGVDHAELGAMFLRRQIMPRIFVEVAEFHHQPGMVRFHPQAIAAVQVADLMVRHAKIGNSGNSSEVPAGGWTETRAWRILFDGQCEKEKTITLAALKRMLDRLPAILEGLV